MTFKRILVACGLCLSLWLVGSCGGGSGSQEPPPPPTPAPPPVSLSFQGLDGLIINELYQLGGALVAASDDGVHRQTSSGSWSAAGLDDHDIMAMALITEQHWLASSYQQDQNGYPGYLLLETFNAGANWQQVDHQFGQGGENEAIHALLFDDAARVIYATGPSVLASSTDMGRSWKIIHGGFGGFGKSKSALTQSADGQTLWYGGQGAIDDGIFFQIHRATGQAVVHTDPFPNPSTIDSIRYAPDDPRIVYASGEGGIIRSNDHGQSWQTILGDVDHRFYYDMVINPDAPDRIFTAGWTKKLEPQPLIIEWTDNAGQSWQQYQYPGGSGFFGGVRSMILVAEGQQQVVYFGLYKGGIMRMPLP